MLKCVPELDQVFHALADPGRRKMVERLAEGSASLGQLAEPLAMSLPAVQQHLRVLERARLVETEKMGRVRQCRLNPEALASAEDWIARRRTHWQARLDRLEAHLAEGDRK